MALASVNGSWTLGEVKVVIQNNTNQQEVNTNQNRQEVKEEKK